MRGGGTVAEGRIEPDTAAQFEQFVKQQEAQAGYPLRNLVIYLNSQGGSLPGGLELGRAFRRHAVNTAVGAFIPTSAHGVFAFTDHAQCASACAFAFLLGSQRFYSTDPSPDHSVRWALNSYVHQALGLRRFSVDRDAQLAVPDDFGAGVAESQVVTADLIAYMHEMDVDPGLLSLSSRIPAGGLYVLTTHDAYALHVANDPEPAAAWTLAQDGDRLTLKSQGTTANVPFAAHVVCVSSHPDQLALELTQNLGFTPDPAGLRTPIEPIRWISLGPDHHSYDARVQSLIWHGPKLHAVVLLSQPILAALAHGETLSLDLFFPDSQLWRAVPAFVLQAPEIAQSVPLLLRTCSSHSTGRAG